jgi:hypothetical protein
MKVTQKYRLVLTYKRTRPYYPPSYQWSHWLSEEQKKNDAAQVGVVKTHVVGPYATKGTVKAQFARTIREHPFANVWGDQEKGFEILDMKWEEAEVKVVWEEFDGDVLPW